MIDLAKITIKAGDGGDGKVSFRREKYVLKGGPDGGYGGNGGSVIFMADRNLASLKQLAHIREITADSGKAGGEKKMYGAQAPDLTIKVPVGTVLWVVAENQLAYDRHMRLDNQRPFSKPEVTAVKYFTNYKGARTERRPVDQINHYYEAVDQLENISFANLNLNNIKKYKLVELKEDGQKFMVAQGGFGGRGNTAFRGSRNTTPLEAEWGGAGEKRIIFLELKILADLGLVGFPSVGKSTLLSKLSQAKPKIAAYDFTTLEPNLGILEDKKRRQQLVLADIPGLIEGASQGKGLGYSFLRHIEACRLLVFVLALKESQVFDEQLSKQNKASLLQEQLEKLKTELVSYNPQLIDKEQLVIINKADLYDEELKVALVKLFPKALLISTITGENLAQLPEFIFSKFSNS